MGFLTDIMIDALRFFSFFGGYGWGIVWLTIAVNLALYPLTLSSIKSMGAMQKIQPKMKELQEKYKDKPQEMQKEIMALYKGEGVNPFGGCLPMLLKIPFFIALFLAFQSAPFWVIVSNPANNTGFLWINGRIPASAFESNALVTKLAKAKIILKDERTSDQYIWNVTEKTGEKILKDVLWDANEKNIDHIKKVREALAVKVKGLDETEAQKTIVAWNMTNSLAKPDRLPTPLGPISVLAILVGVTTYFMQKTIPQAGAGDQAKMMTMFMPAFLILICWNFSSGVQIYWVVSNAVAAVQQYLIMRKA